MTQTTSPNEKRGRLEGGALASADVLASSKHILRPTMRGNGVKGLQQYFTPPEAAALADHLLDLAKVPTFDPTAGDGGLLSSTKESLRFGVELDADQVDAGAYTAIRGDIMRVYPLLRAAGITFPRIVANPPFGLDDWSDPVLSQGKKIGSTLLTWRYAKSLLGPSGAGMFIAGRTRFMREIATGPDAEGLALIIEIDDLFEGVTLPCVIAFFTPDAHQKPPARLTACKSDLTDPDFKAKAATAFTEVARYFSIYSRMAHAELGGELRESFEKIQSEYDRRLKDSGLTQKYDVMVKGGQISLRPSPFAQLAIARGGQYDELRTIQALHKQPISYFALNLREWNRLRLHEREGRITIDPAAATAIEAAIESGRMALRPMYPIPPQMRLGFLDDTDQILCIKDDAERGLTAGNWYPIRVSSRVQVDEVDRLHKNGKNEPELRRFKQERKLLNVTIDRHVFSESTEDIEFLIEHFDVPDPGDLEGNHGAELETIREVLREIEAENGFEFRPRQMEDLARCVLKQRAVLGVIMGGGKTLLQLCFAEASVRLGLIDDVVCFIAPQDLHDQWADECEKFLGKTGRKLEPIYTHADAERVKRHVRAGGTGWYITHYEALSIIGTQKTEAMPVRAVKRVENGVTTHLGYTDEFCPNCYATAYEDKGWKHPTCRKCGFSDYAVRVKPIGSRLSTVFKNGAICVDELSMIRGDYSQRSLRLRGMRAKARLGATGTPIANYVNDCFHGFAWTIGWDSARWPFSYEEGKAKFEADFCVIEHMMGRASEGESHKKKRRKVLPEVTNLSMLWRLLSVNMVRTRHEDIGDMVERTFHTVKVPLGVQQAKMNTAWLQKFVSFFEKKFPDHALVEAGVVERFQAALGLLWKLEYAATMPEADPDLDFLDSPVSNFTPKLMKALDIIEEKVKAGEKVLVGSCLIEIGPLVSGMLAARGIKAAHITEGFATGKAKTMPPKKRAKAVRNFVKGDTEVLCVGVNAMKLGHNIDVASNVVLLGLPWSHEAFEQFLARVWRLSSTKPVDVYCLLANGTIDERKFELLVDKAAASDLALDGKLIADQEETINWDEILTQMQKAGVSVHGDEVAEEALAAAWHDSIADAELSHEPATIAEPAVSTSALISAKRLALVVDVEEGEQGELFSADDFCQPVLAPTSARLTDN